mgnify:CR=1 FL=1
MITFHINYYDIFGFFDISTLKKYLKKFIIHEKM